MGLIALTFKYRKFDTISCFVYTSNYAYSKVVQKVLNNEKKTVILSPTQSQVLQLVEDLGHFTAKGMIS
jgi:hypothetical protein